MSCLLLQGVSGQIADAGTAADRRLREYVQIHLPAVPGAILWHLQFQGCRATAALPLLPIRSEGGTPQHGQYPLSFNHQSAGYALQEVRARQLLKVPAAGEQSQLQDAGNQRSVHEAEAGMRQLEPSFNFSFRKSFKCNASK